MRLMRRLAGLISVVVVDMQLVVLLREHAEREQHKNVARKVQCSDPGADPTL